jgi:hypothetical protein
MLMSVMRMKSDDGVLEEKRGGRGFEEGEQNGHVVVAVNL